jgi:hypothetical protein
MNRDRLNWWLTLLANLGVLGGLVFVGLELNQNSRQLRADASYSITTSVNEVNAHLFGDAGLAELVFRGERDLGSLTPVDRMRFDLFEFARLNIAEYVQDLESEGVSDLNFRYVEWIISEFRTKPGLRAFIREYEDRYVGSDELLARLLGP